MGGVGVGVELTEFDGFEASRSSSVSHSRCWVAIALRTGPGRVPTSAAAAEKKHPPGNTRRSMCERYASHAASSRLIPFRCAERGAEDLVHEGCAGGVDGCELEFLFGAEVGVEAALAHAGREREVPDREALEAVDRRQARGLVEDRRAGSLALGLLVGLDPPSNGA